MKYLKKNKTINVILVIYFFINLLLLTNFPFVHSDEAWLAGLSRTIAIEKSYAVTEPFFDLYPRTAHAIRSIFNTIQIIFFKIIGYNIFTFRLISLIFGISSLFIFYKLAHFFTKSNTTSCLFTILLAVDIQFIYTSHTARQEIILITILLLALYFFLTKIIQNNNLKNNIILGLIISFGIGIHPNSFIIFLSLFFIYIYYLLFTKKVRFKGFIIFLSTTIFSALFFILLSLYFDPNFITNYSSYGKTLGVFSSISTKIEMLEYFYKKLFYQVSGTYFTPNIKIQFYIFSITIIYSVFRYFIKKDFINDILLISFFSINLGYILIGRFNQTSVIFVFPILYLLIIHSLKSINIKYLNLIIFILIIIISANSVYVIINNSYSNYNDYLNNISKTISPDSKVLGNLNTQFYFEYNNLYDYRNLEYLDENNLKFVDYIEKNNIEYIIYPEEMDFIYKNRPKWNVLYGNVYNYYDDMQTFIKNECELESEFTNKTYAMRIARFIGKNDWKVKIYRVKND